MANEPTFNLLPGHREAIRLLREEYPVAKKAVIMLEVFRRTRSKKAVYELRDFLDHLSAAFLKDDEGQIQGHLREATTHLRRSTVEPLEYLAEKQYVRTYRAYRYGRWMLNIPGNPSLPEGAFGKLLEAQQMIVEGREEKTTSRAYEIFKKSFEISTDLYVGINPVRSILGLAAWTIAVVVGTLTVLAYFEVDPSTWFSGSKAAAISTQTSSFRMS